jgi:geranylgeranyl reductase family protein
MKTVAVLGGGPAGAIAAERLARAGLRTLLFDEKLAWEKPCGGGLTLKAYRRYPFLTNNQAPKKLVREMRVAGPSTTPAGIALPEPLLIYSRFDLNGFLLDRAARAGVEIEKARVLAAVRDDSGWTLRVRDAAVRADFCVVATGARNPLRNVGTEWKPADFMMALGYHLPGGNQERIDIQFLPGFQGYIWVFPRLDHLSVGICGKGETSQAMRARLERYMAMHGHSLNGASFYAHPIPSLETMSWKHNRTAGDGWLAAGDAAGLVDPITGEGLYYAMRSGELAAQAILSDAPAEQIPSVYRAALHRDFMADLAFASSIARRVFLGRFALGAIPDRMVQFARRSSSFAAIVRQLVSGEQSYARLKRRLLANLAISLWEMMTTAHDERARAAS